MSLAGGLRLGLSMLTVLPLRYAGPVTAEAGGAMIAVSPAIGALLGGAGAAIAWAGITAGFDSQLAGLLAVLTLALLTRGLHLDGLADTVDGLGSYGDLGRTREVARSGGAGPFAVVALVGILVAQSLAVAQLASQEGWALITIAIAAGRISWIMLCQKSITSAPGSTLGALVAGTAGAKTVTGWWVAAVLAAVFAAGIAASPGDAAGLPVGAPLAAALTVTVAIGLAAAAGRHAVRRFGGLTGDILGGSSELAVTLMLLGFVAATASPG